MFKFSSKELIKRTFQDSEDGHMAKYRKVLDKTEKAKSTNRRFRTKNHCVATYDQAKKRLLFYPNRIFESDETLLFLCKFKFFMDEVFAQIYTLYFTNLNFESSRELSVLLIKCLQP